MYCMGEVGVDKWKVLSQSCVNSGIQTLVLLVP